MPTATGLVVALLLASLFTVDTMALARLPGSALPIVLVVAMAACLLLVHLPERQWRQTRLAWFEWALLAATLAIGLIRLVPYGWQYAAGQLVAPVVPDDNWAFQKIAGLVNAASYPPEPVLKPGSAFYVLDAPWVLAAAVSSAASSLAGTPMVKLGLAVGLLVMQLAIAWALIASLRHLCEPRVRGWALGALLVVGASFDGIVAMQHATAAGRLMPSEDWQAGLMIRNVFPTLTYAVVWIPQHLAAAAAVLLAMVVVSEPVSLAVRREWLCHVVAGLLLGAAGSFSPLVLAGGLVVLLPLLWAVAREAGLARLGLLLACCVLPLLPLAHAHLATFALDPPLFGVGEIFKAWKARMQSSQMGGFAVLVALALMGLEVGWLYLVGGGMAADSGVLARQRRMSLMAVLVLASTAVVSLPGLNEYAMHMTLVAAVLLASHAGHGVVAIRAAPRLTVGSRIEQALVSRAAVLVFALALLAHANELALLGEAGAKSPAFATETDECKAAVFAFNAHGGDGGSILSAAGCRDKLTSFHLERRFTIAPHSPDERDRAGDGRSVLPVRW